MCVLPTPAHIYASVDAFIKSGHQSRSDYAAVSFAHEHQDPCEIVDVKLSLNSALKVIHRNEALDRRSRRKADGGKDRKESEEDDEEEDDEDSDREEKVLGSEDKDGDGVPDDKQRASNSG